MVGCRNQGKDKKEWVDRVDDFTPHVFLGDSTTTSFAEGGQPLKCLGGRVICRKDSIRTFPMFVFVSCLLAQG